MARVVSQIGLRSALLQTVTAVPLSDMVIQVILVVLAVLVILGPQVLELILVILVTVDQVVIQEQTVPVEMLELMAIQVL